MYFYLEKRTVITIVALLALIVGGIAFIALAPSGQQATQNLIQQDDRASRPVGANPNGGN